MNDNISKKVLVLTTTFPRWQNDTTPAFVYELSKRLYANGLKVVVLAPHHQSAKKFEMMDGMKIYRFPYFWPAKYQILAYEGGIIPNIRRSNLAKIQVPLLVLSELYYTFKIMRKEKIDIIHSHWIIPSGLIGGAMRKIFKKPHITTAHAGDVFTIRRSKILSIVGSFVFKNSDYVTANSKYTKEVIISIEGRIKNNVEIVPMGVDISRFNPKKASDLGNLFTAKYQILSVGRLVEKKGIKHLIMAMKYVVKVFPDAKLIIGGSGPEKDILEDISERCGLNEKVIFVGYIKNSDLPKYYASSDIFVLTSIETEAGDTEGLGVVLLEAMASGTPVIGSEMGGITDIIEDGETGLLAKPGNPEDIADKIIRLLRDERERERLSENGLKVVKEKFSWDLVTKQFISILWGAK